MFFIGSTTYYILKGSTVIITMVLFLPMKMKTLFFAILICWLVFVLLISHKNYSIISSHNRPLDASIDCFTIQDNADPVEESRRIVITRVIGGLKIESAIAQNLTPISNKPKATKRILLITTWQTGSTFLGELINSSPGVFYSYEPANFLHFSTLLNKKFKPMELIRSIFNCSFSWEYLKYLKNQLIGGKNIFAENRRVSDVCKSVDENLCIQPKFMRDVCTHFPVQLIKEVRLSLVDVFADGMIEDNDSGYSGDWKVIYLVRDPRSLMSSRIDLIWCQKDPLCSNIQNLCGSMGNDLDLLETLRARQPERYYLMKYEDFSENTEVEAEKLFTFLGIDMSSSVRTFQRVQDKKKAMNSIANSFPSIIGSIRNSTWPEKLSKSEVSMLEKYCSPVIKKLNYTLS